MAEPRFLETRGRRSLLRIFGAALVTGAWAGAATPRAAGAAGAARRVPVAVSKFSFGPSIINARQGETLTLGLNSSDFVHGFSIPELNLRTDVAPGKPVELTVPALREGRFIFLCDNFCGEGHDKMTGWLVVSR